MFKFKLSWFGFVLFNSILITLLNFNLHSFVYEKLSQNLLLTLVFIVAYFGLVH
ncbi:lipid A/FlgG phosphoethanolamine transferase EptC, partial [Campylobacter coli]|nr:lipid A/FlgG phosphoethanolamine transferase EptC [Campylobacter coli]EAK4410826.1 lipid A/FlgG phosphoethanolamine transferase EptC [Campylobacter coli]EAL3855143.1 lipid A/FlgG phosphoethanolamine transferase EptC [Campylobacter coli]EKT7696701.1 lipid A/FlgG phosphoethanolamine transferase EptC [Campylobacter coli]HEE6713299.1 lipid A/FlgG phosphoethanolamine transferase EptC [Campylobacter coli]